MPAASVYFDDPDGHSLEYIYVFTHAGAEWRAELKERFDTISTAMDKATARQGT